MTQQILEAGCFAAHLAANALCNATNLMCTQFLGNIQKFCRVCKQVRKRPDSGQRSVSIIHASYKTVGACGIAARVLRMLRPSLLADWTHFDIDLDSLSGPTFSDGCSGSIG